MANYRAAGCLAARGGRHRGTDLETGAEPLCRGYRAARHSVESRYQHGRRGCRTFTAGTRTIEDRRPRRRAEGATARADRLCWFGPSRFAADQGHGGRHTDGGANQPGRHARAGDHLELALAKAGDLLAKQETPGSILVVAGSVDGDLAAITETHKKHGNFPVEFLAVNEPDSSEDDTLRQAARGLRAKVEPLTADNTDIAAIVRAAARPPVSRSALKNKGTRWQEGGWYLLPLLALLAALAFRRESTKPEEAAA